LGSFCQKPWLRRDLVGGEEADDGEGDLLAALGPSIPAIKYNILFSLMEFGFVLPNPVATY